MLMIDSKSLGYNLMRERKKKFAYPAFFGNWQYKESSKKGNSILSYFLYMICKKIMMPVNFGSTYQVLKLIIIRP